MVVIEDKDTIHFSQGERELTLKEGFARLNKLYQGEPSEVRAVIDRLKRKYERGLK